MKTKTFTCGKCGWQFSIRAEGSILESEEYKGASWFCPHCGATVQPWREVIVAGQPDKNRTPSPGNSPSD